MNTNFRADAKMILKKYIFKLMNTAVFRKTMENVRKWSSENLLAIEMKKINLK